MWNYTQLSISNSNYFETGPHNIVLTKFKFSIEENNLWCRILRTVEQRFSNATKFIDCFYRLKIKSNYSRWKNKIQFDS